MPWCCSIMFQCWLLSLHVSLSRLSDEFQHHRWILNKYLILFQKPLYVYVRLVIRWQWTYRISWKEKRVRLASEYEKSWRIKKEVGTRKVGEKRYFEVKRMTKVVASLEHEIGWISDYLARRIGASFSRASVKSANIFRKEGEIKGYNFVIVGIFCASPLLPAFSSPVLERRYRNPFVILDLLKAFSFEACLLSFCSTFYW